MISALSWVPRGAAKLIPDKYEMTDQDVEKLRQQAAVEAVAEGDEEDKEETQEEAVARARAVATMMTQEDENIAKEFNLDNYDEEDDGILGGTKALTFHQSNEEDPLLANAENDEEDDSDAEDFSIRPSDALLLCARTDSDEGVSNLEVYVYEEDKDNLYVHHDIILPAYPLCLAWFDVPPSPPPEGKTLDEHKGNYVAVGTFNPGIEIWNLDVMDVLEPSAELGGPVKGEPSQADKKKKKKKRHRELKPGSHTDAVMSLSWNQSQRSLLASGSGDATVKLWDIGKEACIYTCTHHNSKVQAVAWNPTETSVLLSGSFDRTVAVFDARNPTAVASASVSSDVECASWNPHNPQLLVVSTDDGLVTCHDARMMGSPPCFTLQAHDKATTSVSFSPAVRDLFATSSIDKTIKIWDMNSFRPTCLVSTEAKEIGAVFCLSFYTDSPFMLAAAGSKGKLQVWDSRHHAAVRSRFCNASGAPLAVPNRSSDVPLAEESSSIPARSSPDDQDASMDDAEVFENPVQAREARRPKSKGRKGGA
mmetsp:Transcript_16029/g.27629  ORF Transcript_16029/g.27629 Transcript_16029/m.27629 type:complete len:536 (+) Transcript_16029:68-1675(+)